MKAYFISCLVLVFLVTSCKNDKSVNETVAEEVDKPFTVTFNAIVEKDDVFQVFYSEDGSESFLPENAITINVTGSPQPQDLVFTMPEDASPMLIRFDIGANPELKQVAFKSFKIEYLNKKTEGSSNDFFKYFYPNTQVEIDSLNTIAKIKILEGEPYDPILGSTIELKNEILKLYNKN